VKYISGKLLALPTYIRLGWKSLPETSTLAYYENSQITAVKSFITLAPGRAEGQAGAAILAPLAHRPERFRIFQIFPAVNEEGGGEKESDENHNDEGDDDDGRRRVAGSQKQWIVLSVRIRIDDSG
jgi:hypothetical protein